MICFRRVSVYLLQSLPLFYQRNTNSPLLDYPKTLFGLLFPTYPAPPMNTSDLVRGYIRRLQWGAYALSSLRYHSRVTGAGDAYRCGSMARKAETNRRGC